LIEERGVDTGRSRAQRTRRTTYGVDASCNLGGLHMYRINMGDGGCIYTYMDEWIHIYLYAAENKRKIQRQKKGEGEGVRRKNENCVLCTFQGQVSSLGTP
jgi:hypothetical protein